MKPRADVRSVSHDACVIEQLRKDPDFVLEYRKAAMEEDDEPRVLLVALRRIAEARGGITAVARKAGIERESLHRALGSGESTVLDTVCVGQGRGSAVDGRAGVRDRWYRSEFFKPAAPPANA